MADLSRRGIYALSAARVLTAVSWIFILRNGQVLTAKLTAILSDIGNR